jgi:hypothetical protein
MFDYDTAAGQIQAAAWEIWTRNGAGMDKEQATQTLKSAIDATHGNYIDDSSGAEWLAMTLQSLGA